MQRAAVLPSIALTGLFAAAFTPGPSSPAKAGHVASPSHRDVRLLSIAHATSHISYAHLPRPFVNTIVAPFAKLPPLQDVELPPPPPPKPIQHPAPVYNAPGPSYNYAPKPYTPPPPPPAPSANSGTWERVAICEEGGRNDPTFGYFGELPSTWHAMGMSGTAGDYSWSTQVSVAIRITGGWVPDAGGVCSSW